MKTYQVLARRYRPQNFQEVIGQDPIVTTLKNAIKNKRLAHAYLFSGSRGTGKTTLARVFAKALNCQNPTSEGEPCNICSTCKEITSGHSLDVLEIDGASHRGIDDIRQINETVGYATSSGGYKIYIIDEVHMLTKEAFNALLKTLEEPPPKVMFFFATTEPHKVPATILSRCQRFNLQRIPQDLVMAKLLSISKDLNIEIDEASLRLLAKRAEGGLRDAESLLDQLIAFHEGPITVEAVNIIFGIMPRDIFFAIDKAGKEGNLKIAFELSNQVFSEGKDLVHFVETLTGHIRTLLLFKISSKEASSLHLSTVEREQYEISSKLYSQEQCLNLLEYLAQAQHQIRFSPTGKIALENILLHVLRSHQRLPIEYLVRKLTELEKNLSSSSSAEKPENKENITPKLPAKKQTELEKNLSSLPSAEKPETKENISPTLPVKKLPENSLSIDPTPSPSDLGIKSSPPINSKIPPLKEAENPPATKPPVQLLKNSYKYDTLLQFAAVELEGTLQKKQGTK